MMKPTDILALMFIFALYKMGIGIEARMKSVSVCMAAYIGGVSIELRDEA
jgi:hypothetical protein